ncbi:Octaprenyl-diphosphate synthase IspB [Helicobacter bizzozeronii]|nr:Octaprenyl-diphosphate synthase IspB [Helicobacter bizzozeronii]
MLHAIQAKIEGYLEEVGSAQVLEMARILGAGKMLRSQLILAICPNHPQVLDFCAIIEMIQSASLLHDDVIDNANTRRGQLALNCTFGDKSAIMLGDIFYSKAFCELGKLDPQIVQVVAQSVVALSRGELKDVSTSHAFNPDPKIYLDIISDKSASLIVASSCGAALLQGLDTQRYHTFGLNFGLAFQIIDDLLDITQPQEVLGKPAFGDFKEGKSTLPYILLYQRLDQPQQEILLSYFKQDNPEAIAWCQAAFAKHGIIQEVFQEAQKYLQIALEAIGGEGNTKLENMAKQILEREF